MTEIPGGTPKLVTEVLICSQPHLKSTLAKQCQGNQLVVQDRRPLRYLELRNRTIKLIECEHKIGWYPDDVDNTFIDIEAAQQALRAPGRHPDEYNENGRHWRDTPIKQEDDSSSTDEDLFAPDPDYHSDSSESTINLRILQHPGRPYYLQSRYPGAGICRPTPVANSDYQSDEAFIGF